MPEEIRPSNEVARGFLSQSRPGRSVLDSLADALNATGGSAQRLLKMASDREVRDVTELLSSPLITEEEAREIESEANFPLARIKAQNRIGGIQAQAFLDEDVLAAVSKAPDAPSARKVLRERQQFLLETTKDVAVQAGMRERFAQVAPSLLAEAAKRRVKAQERREAIAVSEDQRLALEADAPLTFVNVIADQIFEQNVAGQPTAPIIDAALDSVFAFYLAGDDEGGTFNVNAGPALDHIDLVMDAIPNLDQADRLKFGQLRQKIQLAEASQKGSGDTLNKELLKAEFNTASQAFSLAVFDNPNEMPSPELQRRYLASATSDSERRAAQTEIRRVQDEVGQRSIVGTPEAVRAAEQLKSGLLKHGALFLDGNGLDLMDQFYGAVRFIDPALRDQPDKLVPILTGIRDDVIRRQGTDEQERIAFEERQTAIIEEKLGTFKSTGNPKTDNELLDKRAELIRNTLAPALLRRKEREASKIAARLGIIIPPHLNTLQR